MEAALNDLDSVSDNTVNYSVRVTFHCFYAVNV